MGQESGVCQGFWVCECMTEPCSSEFPPVMFPDRVGVCRTCYGRELEEGKQQLLLEAPPPTHTRIIQQTRTLISSVSKTHVQLLVTAVASAIFSDASF